MKDLCAFSPTLCQLMEIAKPHISQSEVFEDITQSSSSLIKKALIYCPDAFGSHAFDHFPELYRDMKQFSTHEVQLRSVVPPVTPVCFASLFTGALHLLEKNEHDVIVVCHQEYDDLVHETGPFSEQAHWALQNHVKTWQLLSKAAQKAWKKDFLVAFTPDHGAHEVHGVSDHGIDCPKDMNLKHFHTLF